MREQIQLDNKGFSLLEMLISIAISGMIVVAALSVVMYGMNNYTAASKETKLQSEMQFTGNLISDLIKEGRASASMIRVTRDADENIETITVYAEIDDTEYKSTGAITAIVPKKQYLHYKVADGALYVYEATEDIGSGDDTQHLVSNKIDSFNAAYVKTKEGDTINNDIAPSGSSDEEWYFSESNLIQFDITYKVSSKTRTTQNTYKFRNK